MTYLIGVDKTICDFCSEEIGETVLHVNVRKIMYSSDESTQMMCETCTKKYGYTLHTKEKDKK